MVYSIILFVSLVTAVKAANDWNQPCLSGVCSYDLPASAGSASGTLKIWGSKDAISDITTAAGWEILGCAPDVLEQDIRLVCTNEDSNAAGCAHLYESPGAVGKIVRLPESCGKNAFARVAKAWIPEDQSIPSALARRLTRRDGTQPQVKALHLDTNFAATDPSKAGAVNFAVKGATVPGANGDIDTSTVGSQRRSRIYGNRGLFDFVGDAIDAISGLNDFDIDKSTTLDPLAVDKKFNLLDQEISCPPVSASLKIDVDAKANALATIGVAASGTIIPPKMDDFAIISSLTAEINGSLDLLGTVSGTLDSGKIKIFEVGIPGLDFPGVLTVGPTFEVNAQAVANLDVDVDLTVGLNYKIDKAELIFPPSSKKAKAAGGTFNVGDTPLKLSVSPSVKATGTVEAHLIPSLNLKLSALGDIVNAGVFLELDASADMKLSLEAQAEGSLTIGAPAKARAIKGRSHPAEVASPVLTPVTTLAPSHTPPAQQMAPPPHNQPSHTKMVKQPMGDNTAIEGNGDNVSSAAEESSTSAKPTATGIIKHHKNKNGMKSSSAQANATTSASANETGVTESVESTGTALETSLATPSATAITDGAMESAESTGTAAKELETSSATPSATATADSAAPPEVTGVKGGNVNAKDINGSFGGCIEIGAGLDVNAGADASFFGLFDQGTKVNLFTKKFQIFKKCFGNNAKRSFPRFPRLTRSMQLQKRELVCPATDVGAAIPIVDQIVQAATIATV